MKHAVGERLACRALVRTNDGHLNLLRDRARIATGHGAQEDE